MPGVYRDPASDSFRYFSYNDYEDRRRRDLDDRRTSRLPSPPPPRWEPFAPLSNLSTAPVAANRTHLERIVRQANEQVAQQAATRAETEQFIDSWNERQSSTDASGILAVLTGSDAIEDDDGWFEQFVDALPSQAGQNAVFDSLVGSPDVAVLTAQDLIAQIS